MQLEGRVYRTIAQRERPDNAGDTRSPDVAPAPRSATEFAREQST
jgi:hypothetical protein